LAPGAFADPDPGQILSYTASGLPADLTFDSFSLTIQGNPQSAGVSFVQIVATDNGSPPLSATNQFQLLVVGQIRLVSTPSASPGILSFQCAGARAEACVLQMAVSLTPPVQWQDLGTGSRADDGWVQFATPIRSNVQSGYFRVMVQP
jgi:hypothetical protein